MPILQNQPESYYETLDGLDTISSAVLLGKRKLRDCQNINFFPVGGYSSRNGYAILNSTSSSANANNGLYMARYSSGNVALRVCGTKLESMTSSLGGTWTDRTGALSLTAGNDNITNFAILNDIVVGCNDTDTCFQINSALSAAALAGSPVFSSALFAVEYRGYMFYGQTVESSTRQYDRLRFSDINAPNAFTSLGSNNYIDIAKKSGGDLRGAVEYKTYLYCFKRHGIYQITFSPTQVNSSGTLFPFTSNPNPVISGIGTQSHRSIVKFRTPITNQKSPDSELVFFVDQYGVPRLFDGANAPAVGYSISKSRDSSIKSLTDMDKTRLGQIWAINYPERSQIFVFMNSTSGGSKHDTCWILDYSFGFAWGRMKFRDSFNCGALFEKSSGVSHLYFGDYTGTVYEYDTGTTDNGMRIDWYAIHGDLFKGDPTIRQTYVFLEIRGSTANTSQDVHIDIYKDGDDTSSGTSTVTLAKPQTMWGSFIWGQSNWAKQGLVTQQVELNDEAKAMRVKVSNGADSVQATIEGFSVYSLPEGSSQV